MRTTMFHDPLLEKARQSVEKQLGPLTIITPSPEEKYFLELADSIISQQLSTKVAPIIFKRVVETVGEPFTPGQVAKADHEALRAAGLSNSKANYLKNIAEAWLSGAVVSSELTTMPDEKVIETLVQIKGIGPWTAEMFLMFTLGRPDVFSVGDYGLKKAMAQIYDISMDSHPKEFLKLSEQWAPNRTLASRILWKTLEL